MLKRGLHMDTLWRDVCHAVRGLANAPGFALSALLSLGIGVGANTTVFAWVDIRDRASVVEFVVHCRPGTHS
jgi:hypothetical protein